MFFYYINKMTLYICEVCNYSSEKKYNYNKHLKTPKHQNNLKAPLLLSVENGKSHTNTTQIPHNTTQYHTNATQMPHKTTQILMKIAQIPHKFSDMAQKIFECEYCEKQFSRKDSLTRHVNKFCKYKNSHEIYVAETEEKMKMLEIEKNELKHQINNLLTRVGTNNSNNNNTINNTININNYGSEDLNHITNSMKTQLLTMPIGMIPKLVEKVHFNPDIPENFNITIDNKNDSYAKIYENGKWSYKDRNETIQDLVDSKYFILDSHYDKTKGKGLSNFQKQNYETFREKYDGNDKNIHKLLNKQCELTILNNRN
jgi:uncharacterized C2H2 Zn-finger protein